MALNQAVKDTILSRFQGGEKLPAIFKDLNVEKEDRIAWKKEYKKQIKDYRKANIPTPQSKEERLASMTVEQLDRQIAAMTNRINKMNAKLSDLQAEKNSR
jgi:hypothetical protein